MFWLIVYRVFQYLTALLIGFALIAIFTQGIAYLLWVIVGIFLFFAWKNQADETKEELEL